MFLPIVCVKAMYRVFCYHEQDSGRLAFLSLLPSPPFPSCVRSWQVLACLPVIDLFMKTLGPLLNWKWKSDNPMPTPMMMQINRSSPPKITRKTLRKTEREKKWWGKNYRLQKRKKRTRKEHMQNETQPPRC